MSTASPPISEMTVRELADRIGEIPLWRVRCDPPPGAATEEDVDRVRREECRLCELIDGVLVEKAVSDEASILAGQLITLLNNFILPRRLGWVAAPDGFVRLFGTQLRAPDVSFVRRDQRPGGRPLKRGYSDTAPALAVEVFSPGNTPGEMQQKRNEFFAAGTELFWIVYPDRREVEVWTGPDACRTLGSEAQLDGGSVLPGFTVAVADLFANL
ncbi:MAG: Uma2 family endonuclease, partial [Planctomycetaceae bacterium]|nr:Uma2 family endonuclease [Planctomycetaceae bacterium]